MEIKEMGDLLDLKAAGARIGVSPHTLRGQARKGVLAATLVGHTWLTTAAEADRYAREHKGKPGVKPKHAPASPATTPIAAVPLDATQIGYFVQEVELECSFALHAYYMAKESEGIQAYDESAYSKQQQKRFEGVMAYQHMMLAHTAIIAKVFWPSPYKPGVDRKSREYKQYEKNQKLRGQQLCATLNVRDTSLLNDRKMRNDLEHYDDRLEEYVRGQIRTPLLDTVFERMSPVFQDVNRLNHAALKGYIIGKNLVDLKPLADAILALRNAARKWLFENRYWNKNDSDAWYNEEDYTLRIDDYLRPEELAFRRELRSRDAVSATTDADGGNVNPDV